MPTTALTTLNVKDLALAPSHLRTLAHLNLFDVAAWARPWERIPVGRTRTHVLEIVRAQGTSPWFANSRDESVLVLDGDILIQYKRPNVPPVPPWQPTAARLEQEPVGAGMGWIRASRGHLARLPIGAAYEFRTVGGPGILLIQTTTGVHDEIPSQDFFVGIRANGTLPLEPPDVNAASGCAHLLRAINVFDHLTRNEPSWDPSHGFALNGSVIGLPDDTAIAIPRFASRE